MAGFKADYLEKFKTKQVEVQTSQSALMLEDAMRINPDEYARDRQLGQTFGIPADVASTGRDVLASKLQQQKMQLLLKTAPVLRSWISDQDNARVAHDDVENLSWFEGFAKGAGDSLARGGIRTKQMLNQYLMENTTRRYQDSKKSFGQMLAEEQQNMGLQDYVMPGMTLVDAASRWIDVQYANAFGLDDQEQAKQFAANIAGNMKAIESFPMSPTGQGFWDVASKIQGGTFGETVKGWMNAIINDPVGALSFSLETAGESAPQLAAAAGVTAATKSPQAGIATLGAGSFLSERYTSPVDFLKEKGIDLGNPADVARVVNDPDLLKEAADKGAIRGAIVGIFDMISGGLAGRTLVQQPVVEAVAQTVQQAINGMLGEYSARVATGQPVDWNDIIAEGVAEVATTPVDMGIAGRDMLRKRQAAKSAEQVQARLDALSQAAAASKLKQRPGGAFEDYVNQATAGTEVQDVYVPATIFQTYFQGAGMDPKRFFSDLYSTDAFDDYQTALATGGDVKIPTGTYTAKIIGSDLEPVLRDHIRFQPDQMTATEAAEFNARAEDALQEAFDAAEESRRFEAELQSYESKIYDEMVHRLRVAGRSADVARNEAMIYPAFFKAMAARSGLSVEEFALRFTLPQVRGELAQGMQLKDVGAVDRALIEARSAVTAKPSRPDSQPLLEWLHDYGGVSDPGGELKARGAEVIRRGKGKAALKLVRKPGQSKSTEQVARHSMDIVAQAAVEAGFMADDPRVNAWKNSLANGTEAPDLIPAFLDAVDAELSGKPKVSDQTDQFLAYLDSLGMTLQNTDEEIKAAVKADQERMSRDFQQGFEKSSSLIDPLLQSEGEWRNAEVTAVLEDGEEVKVNAGDAVDHLLDRLKSAQEILDCINAA